MTYKNTSDRISNCSTLIKRSAEDKKLQGTYMQVLNLKLTVKISFGNQYRYAAATEGDRPRPLQQCKYTVSLAFFAFSVKALSRIRTALGRLARTDWWLPSCIWHPISTSSVTKSHELKIVIKPNSCIPIIAVIHLHHTWFICVIWKCWRL